MQPEEAALAEAPSKQVGLEDTPLRKVGKGIPGRRIRVHKGLGAQSRCLLMQGQRGKQAGEAGWGQIMDTPLCLSVTFILSIN